MEVSSGEGCGACAAVAIFPKLLLQDVNIRAESVNDSVGGAFKAWLLAIGNTVQISRCLLSVKFWKLQPEYDKPLLHRLSDLALLVIHWYTSDDEDIPNTTS